MSKYATTMYNRFTRVDRKVKDLFFNTIHFKHHFDHWLSEWKEIEESADYKKLNVYYQGYVRGMRNTLREQIWQNHVVWMFDVEDGTGPHLYESLTAEQKAKVHAVDDATQYGHHYWKSDTTKRWS